MSDILWFESVFIELLSFKAEHRRRDTIVLKRVGGREKRGAFLVLPELIFAILRDIR